MLIWIDKFLKVKVLLEDRQFVHCNSKMAGYKGNFYLTAVYGSNNLNERKDLWSKLVGFGHLNKSWIILGDFNVMIDYNDRCGGRQVKVTKFKMLKIGLFWAKLMSFAERDLSLLGLTNMRRGSESTLNLIEFLLTIVG
uniref:Uncharacterized protein n=1 Tax=Cannabis sativa TaxID=3483 RepID=A0A803PRF0_CANSA